MVISNKLDLRLIFLLTWKRMLGLLLISSLVYASRILGYAELLRVDSLPASVMGVALSILLGFKINSAYTRWWDARKLWGAVVNDSRSFTRELLNYCPDEETTCQRMVMRQIAFAYSLKLSLRRETGITELLPFLSKAEYDLLGEQRNIPQFLLQVQGKELAGLCKRGIIEPIQQSTMENAFARLTDSQGGCERIKNTGFPNSYTYHLNLFILIYSYLLPFIFITNSDWHIIPATIFIGYVFLSLSTIAQNLEDPFENTWYDVPMSAICRTIEINLSQQLGLKDLPAFAVPENGFLH